MRIAVASKGNPKSTGTWSGIPAHIISALERKGHEVAPITLHDAKEPWHYDWLRRFYYRTQKRWFLSSVEEQWLKEVGKQLDKEVAKTDPEVVLVIHGDWLAYTSFQKPSCIIHDTTFATLVDYYPAFTNLTSRSVRSGNRMYQKALQKASAAVFSADWATQSAIHHYGITASKVATIPFGANLNQAPAKEEVYSLVEKRLKSGRCNLLFLGIDWERKGGPDSLLFLKKLLQNGINSHLTIVGCSPQIPAELENHVTKAGFLRKDNKADELRIKQILEESHALLLPSLAECYGCVYCEANAYGLPALGRDTGGVSEIIKDGVNGLLLSEGDSVEEFAMRWAEVWRNPSVYKKLAENSYQEFTDRLNYDVFVTKLEGILTEMLQKNN
ncbi:glycosyltransferase family 4 protein [Sabulibacter ruber]|uniref:glycosyltransferase family 4 protein n=1 Tax=Sabulibacter ruber TaxID=2811901 RepID=UPI001A97940A|nr:glycosyltransferase family 4 protein [Sabulibacter ruber]